MTSSSSRDSFRDLFKDCTLFASLRSPFARRVRIALIEHGLSYHEVMEDVFRPSPSLLERNPLGRVPVVTLKNGLSICESHQILTALSGTTPSLEEASISGLMTGLCDKIVERLLESMRPKESQDADIFSEFEALLPKVLARLEAWARTQELPASGQRPSQAQIDAAVALAYLSLRVTTEWKSTHPRSKALLEALEARPSFQKTSPPPA